MSDFTEKWAKSLRTFLEARTVGIAASGHLEVAYSVKDGDVVYHCRNKHPQFAEEFYSGPDLEKALESFQDQLGPKGKVEFQKFVNRCDNKGD